MGCADRDPVRNPFFLFHLATSSWPGSVLRPALQTLNLGSRIAKGSSPATNRGRSTDVGTPTPALQTLAPLISFKQLSIPFRQSNQLDRQTLLSRTRPEGWPVRIYCGGGISGTVSVVVGGTGRSPEGVE